VNNVTHIGAAATLSVNAESVASDRRPSNAGDLFIHELPECKPPLAQAGGSAASIPGQAGPHTRVA